ncbi:hypothetical protein J4731_06750 [Providencia rettgeri]|nr:hypothetical protein [Providencia rettgeri]
MPWVSFDSFNLNIADTLMFFTPDFHLYGEYYSDNNKKGFL